MTILALFVFHAVIGALEMIGVLPGELRIGKISARILLTGVIIHVMICLKLTIGTLTAIKRSGTGYFKENKLFWIRRISGFAVIIFLAAHFTAFIGKTENGIYILNRFGIIELTMSVLLVLTLLLHLMTNIRPLMLGFGTIKKRGILTGAALTAAILMLFMGAAFLIYFIRWLQW